MKFGSSALSRRRLLQAAAFMTADKGSSSSSRPTSFVLVPGAWHGGWCYARVAKILRAQGHQVFTPTLTGVGERSHLARCAAIDWATHVEDVVNVIRWEQLQAVVLCGHSYGGLVISGVADSLPDRIASLVYVDAVIGQNDRSAMDDADPQQALESLKRVTEYDGGMLPPYPAAALNVNLGDRAMVDALCTPQPFTTLTQRLKLTGAHLRIEKKTFVRATRWPGSAAVTRTYDYVRRDPSWTVIDVGSGHDVMLDAPNRLAEILLDVR